MAHITTIELKDADDELRQVYDQIIGKRGKLAEVHKIQSLNPPALEAHMALYKSIMFASSPLSRAQREMIGVIVSASNQCDYCVSHHREALMFYWKDSDKADSLVRDRSTVDLSEMDHALCQLASQLTTNPSKPIDMEGLRKTGLNDRAILDAVQVVAYFNFVNRMVLSLGVESAGDESKGYAY